MSGQKTIVGKAESGQEVAKPSGQAPQNRFHVDYWKDRLYRKTFTRSGRRHEVPEWSVRLQHLGRREAFALGSVNAQVAAAKAKDVAMFLEANGWAPTLAKFKPGFAGKAHSCTVGEFLKDVAARSHLKPMTCRRYAVKLRKIIADLAKVEAGMKPKQRAAKYDYHTGGRAAWLAKVNEQPLDILSPAAVNGWRNRYVAQAGDDPVKRKSAERSAASTLRCARALFSPDVINQLRVKLPPPPFEGVRLKDPGPQRFHSEVNPEWLMTCAERELWNAKDDEEDDRKHKRQIHLALVLCLWAGLRRKEADLLTWGQVDLAEGQINIRRTIHFEPKTEESQRTVDLPTQIVAVLRSFKDGSDSEFVLKGAESNPSATFDYYRADSTWRDLNAWLRKKGIRQQKAIHSLRKESGSLVAADYGIEAARHHLGHRDIRTTSAHYVEKKRRVEVRFTPSAGGLRVVEGEK